MTKKQLLQSFKGELQALNYSKYTIQYYGSIISQFLDLIGVKDSYNRQDIFRFLEALSPLGESSKRTYIRVVKSFFDSLEITWPLKKKDIRGGTEIGGEALTEDEAEKILDYAKQRDLGAYAMLRLLAVTGMRAGEIGLLDRGNYNPPILKIYLEKEEDFRVSKLDEETIEAINKYLKSRKDDNEALFLFPSRRIRIDGAGVGRVFRKVAEACNIYRKGLGPHSIRRGWATWLAKRGMDIYSLQKVGNWKSISMPARYVRLIPSEAEEKAKELNPLVRR